MTGERTDIMLEQAVMEELNNCIKRYGEFHNHHESFSVLREEVEEVVECFLPFNKATTNAMDALWDGIRSDEVDCDYIESIRKYAEELAKETIQVMAMCDKWMDKLENERPKTAEMVEGA